MYEPKRVLVTGGSGFIASHIIDLLISHGYFVLNVDVLSYCSSLENNRLVKNSPLYQFVQGDIQDTNFMRFLLDNYSIDTVIHAAAQTHVDNSFGNSIEFTKHNVLGTHCLLEAARVYGKVQRFIHVSTDEVYGRTTMEGDAWSENAVLKPTNPYAATKAAAEMLVHAYRTSFGLPIIITRGNNVYGPRQFPEKLIPKFIHQLSKGHPCTLHGEGESLRHFIYCTDVAEAFLCILRKGVVGETYNIGCEEEVSVKEMASLLKNLVDPTREDYLVYVEDRAFNDLRYPVDVSKLGELGWSKKIEIEEGLKMTLKWYNEIEENYWPATSLDKLLAAHPSF